jgi:peptidoglycan/LPS O-acetylase OafA/YrhL
MLAYGIRLTLYLALSVAVAGASFRFVERPFLELKKRFRSREENVTTSPRMRAEPAGEAPRL